MRIMGVLFLTFRTMQKQTGLEGPRRLRNKKGYQGTAAEKGQEQEKDLVSAGFSGEIYAHLFPSIPFERGW